MGVGTSHAELEAALIIGGSEQGRGSVEGTSDSEPAALQDVGIDHRCFDILVAEEFLDGADTCPDRRCWVS
jgi:hypothetical protein